MSANKILIPAVLVILAVLGGCSGADQQAGNSAPASASSTTGDTVLRTMDSGGYTYVEVDTGEGPAWYAGPQTEVAVGDKVDLPKTTMPMQNFESKTLGRTFDVIYFVEAIRKTGAAPAAGGAHRTAPPPAAAPSIDLAGIEKAEGGMTVAEVFGAGADAAGRQVVLRGKVVKFNAGIMGKNWVHVRDGTGEAGTNDLTITTMDTVKVGDTVLVTGTLAADRDFGYGYHYPLLIEEARVAAE